MSEDIYDATDIYTDADDESPARKGKSQMYETAESASRRAVLVSAYDKRDEEEAKISLDELALLLDTAGGSVSSIITQVRERPDGKTYIGKGKIEELSAAIDATGAELVIFDTELSPVQIKQIEAAIDGKASVIDRSMLILDIFASRATSAEGRLQVELAQLQYTAPRLIGKGRDMSRLGGGVGTRGPGETKLEIDRRRLKERIKALEDELERVSANRMIQRASRERSEIPCFAVVGYTNAGKSTLLNKLTDADIFAEDKLFATLDPTTRKYTLPSGRRVLLTDTVGFIRNLPHHLISAFRSTLDEAVYADALIIVCDSSDPNLPFEMEVTKSTLADLGAVDKPTLIVFNKCDAVYEDEILLSLRRIASSADEECVFISALNGDGLEELASKLDLLLSAGKKRVRMNIPLSDGKVVSSVYKICEDVSVEYFTDHIEINAVADAKGAGQLKSYIEDYDVLFPASED